MEHVGHALSSNVQPLEYENNHIVYIYYIYYIRMCPILRNTLLGLWFFKTILMV